MAVTVDNAGCIYISDSYDRVRKVSPDGIITTVAGNGMLGASGDGGKATNAELHNPNDVALDRPGNLYISDGLGGPVGRPAGLNRIRKVSPNGIITTFAGTGNQGFSGDGGPATKADLNAPNGVVVDGEGNVYIADLGNARVRKVATNGVITTVAGTGQQGFSGDGGKATSAELNGPHGIALDDTGNLYITDDANNRIRKVGANGVITTVAGNGTAGFSGDGGQATKAMLFDPLGVAVDRHGNLYVADFLNSRVREVAAGPSHAGLGLLVSAKPDRSGPQPLVGAELAGKEYVFVPDVGGIRDVTFSLDGKQQSIERIAAYDFARTAATGQAYPFDFTKLASGAHRIDAVVGLIDGSQQRLSANFTTHRS